MKKRKIKLCIIIPSKFPIIGGYENLVFWLSKVLSKKFDVHIICKGINNNSPIPKNITVHNFPSITKIRFFSFIINNLFDMIRFSFLIKREKIDIVNCHPSFPTGIMALPSKLFNIPMVCTSHGDDILVSKELNYGSRKNVIASILIKFILKSSDVHTLVSKSIIKYAVESGSNLLKIKVIYNGLDFSEIKLDNVNEYNEFGIKKDDFIILFMGRLIPVKDPYTLLISYSKIIEKITNSKLIIAGSGEMEEILKRYVDNHNLNDKVNFVGFVEGKSKWNLIGRADIFVQPSIIESFGITIIEAMACEKPVIATDTGPFTEIINDRETGLLVKPRSPENLSRTILKLANDKKFREKLGKNAKKEVKERFDINKIANDYIDLYNKLIKEKR